MAMAKPLEGCVIALAGKLDQLHDEIAKQIKANGGKHVAKIDDRTTHLVADLSRLPDRNPKVQQIAQYPVIHLVGYQWLVDSISSQVKQSEAVYKNDSSPIAGGDSHANPATTVNQTKAPSSAKASNPTAAGKGKKRPRDESVPIYEDPSTDEAGGAQPPSKKFKDGQKATSSSLRVPVDEHCSLAGTHRVYIDPDGIIYDASLNQTSSSDNHNKYYRIQLLVSPSGNCKTWTRWGRVGAAGSCALLGNGSLSDAVSLFEKKFKEKSGNSWDDRLEPTRTDRKKPFYSFIEREYGINHDSKRTQEISASNKPDPVKSQLPKQVQGLMELIFNKQYFEDTMRVLDYDAEKLPLGQLSKRTLDQGFGVLKDLGQLLARPRTSDPAWTQSVERCSNMFYTVIPHSFGMQRPPIIRTQGALRKEITLMESLSDLEIANTIMEDRGDGETEGHTVHPLDRQFAALNIKEILPLSQSSREFLEIKDYLHLSQGSTHDIQFRVQDIFRIARKGEAEQFDKAIRPRGLHYTMRPASSDKEDRRLLWHGSRCTNFGGILSQGLRIAPPEAPVSGYAFGKGVYFADASSKSANYCHSYTSGDTGLLLLCEVLLKRKDEPHMLHLEAGDCAAEELAKQAGCIATYGKGRTGPQRWKDAGSDAGLNNKDLAGVMMPDVQTPLGPTGAKGYLQYNEYIVYNVAQVKLRYLLRVEMK